MIKMCLFYLCACGAGIGFYLWIMAASGPTALAAYQCNEYSPRWQSAGCVAIEGVK